MFKTAFKLAAASALCLLLAGCATLFGDNYRTINVTSVPSGATVKLNNAIVGTTPTQVSVKQVAGNYITIRKPGFQAETKAIPTKFQKVGWFNVLFPPFFLVDLVADTSLKLDTHGMFFQMTPIGS